MMSVGIITLTKTITMCKDVVVISVALEQLSKVKTRKALIKARKAVSLLLFLKTTKVMHCSPAELCSILEGLDDLIDKKTWWKGQ